MESPTSADDDRPQAQAQAKAHAHAQAEAHDVTEPADVTEPMTPAAIESQVSWAEDLRRRLSERLDATAEQ